MEIDDQAAEEQENMGMPAMSAQDQLTYDPTQGRGSTAWEMSTRASRELNAQMQQHDSYMRRN